MRDEHTDEERPSDGESNDADYGFFRTEDGETVVYDRHNPEAWIQSTYSVAVEAASDSETSA